MSIATRLKNAILINIVDAVENKVDGSEIMRDRIRPIVKGIMKTERGTDKMLKGPVTDFLRELYYGIHGKTTCANLEQWQHSLNIK